MSLSTASMEASFSSADHPASPHAFFDAVRGCCLRAQDAAGGPLTRSFNIGGHRIELSFAGSALEPLLTPALNHLEIPAGSPPALRICLFDSASTGIDPPPPPWSADDYIARGEVQGYGDDRFQTGYNVGTGVLSLLDSQRNLAIYWVRDARQIPYWETGAPLRTLLHWWMRGHGRQLAHAAAVGTAAGAALIAGRGGAGKSTTALLCLASGMRYLGDDYVLLDGTSEPTVYSLYSSAKLDPEQMRRFPDLLPAVANARRFDTEKALAFLHGRFSRQLARSLPVRALVLPRISGRANTRIAAVSPAAALIALAPSTIFQLADAGTNEFHALSDFVRKVPCFALELGTDLPQIAAVVRDVLEEG